jgi:phosphopantothenoylcysteine decarboxylase/phosphopantothenate--cysteine ligase
MKQSIPLIVTIGPTQEPLDAMRILSNRSTGELGTLLASSLALRGHQVIALRGTGSSVPLDPLYHENIRIIPFSTTEDLQMTLVTLSREQQVNSLFHAAAVSDFYLPGAGSGKIPTREGSLTITLEPTPKLLPKMRGWFPSARIIGWKFEASGDRDSALSAAAAQIAFCDTDACVVNGPSYGEGFGVLTKSGELIHVEDRNALCKQLAQDLDK